jgi:dual specificity tyrosine-phosphorylation-regulated kinase 2/3/4
MWSFGCIIAELTTGTPLFPAMDENELLEMFIVMVGLIPQEMLQRAKKRRQFFTKDGQVIKSKKSRLQSTDPGSYPFNVLLATENDDELFIDFVEVNIYKNLMIICYRNV